ncbi:MAG: hypothetical protein JXB26_19290 [Candidatus Aminicenantes bacterium]|nr:hypothetical protein [Candidatus Aminicenantes bacterium]
MTQDYKSFAGQILVNFYKKPYLPSVKGWNRLEGRPRTEEFDKTLRAEVRDALWMLSRQWQMGEYIGSDTGSPAFAKVKIVTSHINQYKTESGMSLKYDETIPLETRVEMEPFPLTLPTRIQIGRYWLKLLADAGLSRNYKPDFINKYPIKLPDRIAENNEIFAHQEVWQLYAATAGRSMDGGFLLEKIEAEEDILAEINCPNMGDKQKINDCANKLKLWFHRQYLIPEKDEKTAWIPSNLEYGFTCEAPHFDGRNKTFLLADEYHHGHLDWYSFDIHLQLSTRPQPGEEPEPGEALPQSKTFTFIPTNVEFGGMPNLRWWEFEDRKTHFGDIDAHTTDLAKLLLIEFGLIFANDWFVIPYDLPVGSLARIDGLAVTNVFGEQIWIAPAGSHESEGWQKWSMYNMNIRGIKNAADRSIFLVPAVDRLLESEPIERVKFIRDEMANMVWAIESTIQLHNGDVKDGYEVATELLNYLANFYVTPEGEEQLEGDAKIRYTLMTGVAENWIPFIPVRIPGESNDNREIQLQRAAMVRTLPGAEEKPKVRPRTGILSHNKNSTYFIHEEEVPRAGAYVSRTFQRARWYDGKVCVWLGRRKRTGRGEGSSGLRFDHIDTISPKEKT